MKRLAVALATVAAGLGAAASASAQLPASGPDPTPYGTNDSGGFRNVLPPGENGLDNFADFTRASTEGTPPPHFTDQLDMYTDLLYASPMLKHDQLPNFFKDATFGVKPDDVESTIHPRE